MSEGQEFRPDDSIISEQAAAVLAALSEAPRTTSELRGICSCMSPASRVLDLRKAGYAISTCRAGRQAHYVLERGQ